MPYFASLIVTPLIGAVLAFLVMFGLVQSQSAGPDQNPAEQAALVYGE
jgi:phosphate/sulfate permease